MLVYLSKTLTSVILKVDVVCDVAMTYLKSQCLNGELRDLLYNQCIGNMFCYSFLFLIPIPRYGSGYVR